MTPSENALQLFSKEPSLKAQTTAVEPWMIILYSMSTPPLGGLLVSGASLAHLWHYDRLWFYYKVAPGLWLDPCSGTVMGLSFFGFVRPYYDAWRSVT